MIQVQMLDDIRSYQTKFLGSFTKRQCICLAVAAPLFFIFLYVTMGIAKLSFDTAIVVSLVLPSVIAACGWIKISNLPFEQYVIKVLYRTVFTTKVRLYKTKLPVKEQFKYAKKQAEKEYTSKLSKKELKAYEKKKKAEEQKNINYGQEKYYN